MSTRGLYGFRKNGQDKLTYNHWDSYPENLGKKILDYCRHTSIKDLNDVCDAIVLVEEDSKPTTKMIQHCIKAGYSDFSVSTQRKDDWYCLLHNIMGDFYYLARDVAVVRRPLYMIDNHDFIEDSLFCEYAYIINLDNETLEFWNGGQTKPDDHNRYGTEAYYDGYYPCKRLLEIPLKEIEDTDKLVILMVARACEDTTGEKYDDETALPQRYVDMAEALDWKVTGEEPLSVRFSIYSPAGEDFSFTVQTYNLVNELEREYQQFDVEEHVTNWVIAKSNGYSGIPSIVELLEDAKEIKKLLFELYNEIKAI